MKSNNSNSGAEALSAIISILERLDAETQKRTMYAVSAYLNLSSPSTHLASQGAEGTVNASSNKLGISFSENRDMSPKEFIRDKLPQTDVERIACLAYYLTHYRQTPHFKTLDLSSLNTEAAQPKFSNAGYSVENALKYGYLAPSSKSGSKQLSAMGELFVQQLPDREAAKASVETMKKTRRQKKTSKKKSRAV